MKLEQIIFIVVASVVGLLIVVALLFRPIKKMIYKKKYINIYGRTIYQLVLDNDFFLINQLVLKLDDNNEMHIDHVVFGEKYIYVIKDRFYNGKIEGKPLDESWVFRNGKKSKYVDNPLILNSLRIEKLSLLSGIDKTFFISIVVVNGEAMSKGFGNADGSNYIVSKNRLKKLIMSIEKRDVPMLDQKAMEKAVLNIASLNLRDKDNDHQED